MLSTVFEVMDKRRLRGARLGAGPPLILLHGYPDNLQIWEDLAPRLSRQFEVIAFDWPGMGYSEEWPGGATPEFMADRILQLLDHWSIERTSVMGMDMGGQPALVFAAKYPERIEKLTVMNCLAFGDQKTSWEIQVLRNFGWNRIILNHFPQLVFRRALRTFLPRGKKLPDALRADLWESFRKKEVRRFISKMCAGYQGTLDRLPGFYTQIQCPVLILWGAKDQHFPLIQGEKLHQSIAHSRLQVLPEGEHWMAWHSAEDVAHSILELWTEDPEPCHNDT